MRIGLLAEEVYRRGSPVYLAGATPAAWPALKKELEGLGIEFIAVELRPEDGAAEWLILASGAFRSGDVPAVAKRISLGRSAKKLNNSEGAAWLLSMVKTVDTEGYRFETSKLWGLLVIEKKES